MGPKNEITELRQETIKTAQELDSSGLSIGAAGNVSFRTKDGFIITPTGVEAAKLSIQQLVHLDYDGSILNGNLLPSSEWQMHSQIYQARSDIDAIVHCHSRYATALACCQHDIPAFHYMIAVAGGNSIRCAPYSLFGTEQLGKAAVVAMDERNACLLANHGQLTGAKSISEALKLAMEVEGLSAAYHACLAFDDVHILSEGDMHSVLKKFKYYGQQTN
tara:strand:+ start:1119 stop:1775 length:657 start_codon:yes stop_codon:yes gene_type:complete